MIRYLTQDILSHTNRSNFYGVRGEKVSLITDGVGAKIVENDKGKRFSVKDEFLSVNPVEIKSILLDKSSTEPLPRPEKKVVERESNKPLTKAQKLQIEYLNSKK